MPFFLHDQSLGDPPSELPTDDRPFWTVKADAVAARVNGQSVIYLSDPGERDDWRRREANRLCDARSVPWVSEDWARRTPNDYCRSTDTTPENRVFYHYAHLSEKFPGKVAYTPNDEYGHTDRQLTTTPGRYLEQFAPHLSPSERDAFTAAVRAMTGGDLQLARTARDIERVYRSGPDSCMSHERDYFSGSRRADVHPTAAYADSDLAIAYLGALRSDECAMGAHPISARAIVWPDRKRYGRIYGDTALAHVLTQHGYTHADTFHGAKLTRIEHNGGFILPYLDCGYRVRDTGTHLVITSDSSEINAQQTHGWTEYRTPNTCENCETEIDDDARLCESCWDDENAERWTCDRCDETFREDQDSPNRCVDNRGEDVDLCDQCESAGRVDCHTCGETFHFLSHVAERQAERQAGDYPLCADCVDTHVPCRYHADTFIGPNTQDTCRVCDGIRDARILRVRARRGFTVWRRSVSGPFVHDAFSAWLESAIRSPFDEVTR